MKKKIITIGREFGSGGRIVAQTVAEKMGYKFYDKELIARVAEASGFSQDYIEDGDEHAHGGGFLNMSLLGASTFVRGMNSHDSMSNSMSIRVPDLAAWEAAATLPPTSAAARVRAGSTVPTAPAASTAPAGMRMKVCSVSQPVSTPGTLSATNSTTYMNPAATSTAGCERISRPGGNCAPSVMPMMPSMKMAAYKLMPLAQAAPMVRAMMATTCIS